MTYKTKLLTYEDYLTVTLSAVADGISKLNEVAGIERQGEHDCSLQEKGYCACNDPSCERSGELGEVEGHIENCSCRTCHQAMGSVK